ncbi:hypothetical protein AAHB41_06030 [Pediococcus pentosaceus]|uniref:hypothetical protein n=1 Tax=Pediococcus pentosaceus TaxID=1255 RepID=UPI002FEF008F
MEKKKMAKALQDSINRFELHVGAGDSEHMPADEDHNGFMTTEQVKELGYAMGDKMIMPAGTDIFKLPPGHYAGTGFKGSTKEDNASWEIIDIYRSSDSYWQYWETMSFSGEVFFQNRHLGSDGQWNNSAYNGWQKIEKTAPLWSGNLSQVGTGITMTDEWRKFSYFRITVDNLNAFAPVLTVKRAPTISVVVHNLASDAIAKDTFEAALQFDGKNVKLIENIQNTVDASGDHVVKNGGLKILAIDGVI